MLVVCRSCAREYAIGPGRPAAKACSSCDEGPLPPLRGSRTPRGAATRVRAAKTPGRWRRRLRSPALLLLLSGSLIATAIVARAGVVSALPHTAVLYRAAGLPVHIGDFVLRGGRATMETQDGQPILVVEGEIAGLTRTTRPTPHVVITLRGRAGETVYRWSVPPNRAELGSGETASFRGRLAAPPPGISDVELTLASTPPAVASGVR